MKLWLAKVGRTLIPADYDAEQLMVKMGDGECAEFRVVRPRSVQWHRMYFGICRTIGQNQDPNRDEDSIDAELRVLAGHFTVVPVVGVPGVEIRMPKRIAFDKLTADEWSALWPNLETAIRERFGDEYIREAA
jgi:hypothetical protein